MPDTKYIFPANFQLVAAMNPCPCGNHGTGKCSCSPYDIKRYTQRISGPILDRIDIQKYMGKVNLFEKKNDYKNPSSQEMLAYFGTPKKVFEASRIDLPEKYKNIETFIKELNSKDLSVCESILEENHKKNVKSLTTDDPLYRADARSSENAPLVLYYKGKISSANNYVVVVVEGGARSGAVITGEFALKSKKKVYAVPNNIFINSSLGCLKQVWIVQGLIGCRIGRML